MTFNKLQMNEGKTDVLLVTAKRVVNLQHPPEFMNINSTCINFSLSVRNVSITFDSTLSLHPHVMNVCIEIPARRGCLYSKNAFVQS